MKDLALGLSEADAAELARVAAEVESTFRAMSAAQARHTRALAAAERLATGWAVGMTASRDRDMTRRTVASEIAVPLRLSDRAVQRRMSDAGMLVTDYPATMTAWEEGRISREHVLTIRDAGLPLSPQDRAEFDGFAASIGERTSAGRAKEALESLAERLNPRSLTERHRDARRDRQVWVQPLGDGMSRLTAEVPTLLGEGIRDRIDRMATAIVDARERATSRLRAQRAAGAAETNLDTGDLSLAEDTRTKDQIRADVLVDLLLTGAPEADPTANADGRGELGAIRGHMQVVVTAATLAGADENPADLVGVGTVDAASARELARECSGFDRLFLDPATRQILATDRYTPTRDLRRRLRARDRHCRFPGCRVPAIRCELDHTVDHALGGPTCLANLAGLCQRHHTMKQFTPWRVRQVGGGVLEWTSPIGRVYVDEPPVPVVMFVPDAGPPPPF